MWGRFIVLIPIQWN